MKKSKQTNTSKRVDGADNTLSNLPDPILHLILSGLPTTEEVIRTSILSRRWRYLWTSVPSIDIDYSRRWKSVKEFRETKFREFVYWVLLKRSLDLDSFRVCCPESDYYDMTTVGRWINVAVTRNVKQLHLSFRPEKDNNLEMPHCLVTCGSLEVLRLSLLEGRLSLPNFTGFTSLRVLELKDVTLFNNDLVEAFFKSLTLLDDLSLIECEIKQLKVLCISCLKVKSLRIDNREKARYFVCGGDLRISCPKLAGIIASKFYFDSLDSLKEAVIHSTFFDDEFADDTFARISHVECLSISMTFAAKFIKSEVDIRVSLPNLKTLELTIDCVDTDPVQFIKRFPNLESLHLNIDSDIRLLKLWKLNDDAAMRISTRLLKKVDYLYFNGRYSQLEVASLFLEHGNALEEMVFIWDNEAKFHEKSKETMKILSKFHKASSTVKLIACLKDFPDKYFYNFSSKV